MGACQMVLMRRVRELHSGVYAQGSSESISGKFQQSSSGYGILHGGLDSMSGQSQQSSNGFYGGQYGIPQQKSEGHYAGNTGIYQQGIHNAGIGQSEQSSSVYLWGKIWNATAKFRRPLFWKRRNLRAERE
ncbi:hypothetical protein Fot_56968 [Forsythia ovata]|uniref:Uncharacterized protein n=1 Tax=Forsythia ovata TaxID=205694 RepID=A0ABD1NXF1_9LAMI